MKSFSRRMLAAILCIVLTLTMLAACGNETPEATATNAAAPAAPAAPAVAATDADAEDGKYRIVNGYKVPKFEGSPDETYHMNVMVSGVEYWFPVYEMFKWCAWELGVKAVYGGTTEMDANKQIASFEQALAQKPAGIFCHPVNGDAFIAPINKAIDSGVPVVTFANDSPKSKRRVFITSDNVYEGQVCAQELAKALNEQGEIAMLENPGQTNHDIYMKSVQAELEKNYPNMKIVASAAPSQDTTKAYNASLSFIQAHPNLSAIITPEGPDALGAAQAAKEKGGKVLVLTRDLNEQILNMIKAGEVWGAINPDQGMQGYFGMLTLFVSKHTELVDPMSDYMIKNVNPVQLPYINNGMTVVTAENADAFYWDKYLKRRGTKGIDE